MGLGGLGMWEMLLIFLVVLLLFGAKRLPEIGSSLGKGIREVQGLDSRNRTRSPDSSASEGVRCHPRLPRRVMKRGSLEN